MGPPGVGCDLVRWVGLRPRCGGLADVDFQSGRRGPTRWRSVAEPHQLEPIQVAIPDEQQNCRVAVAPLEQALNGDVVVERRRLRLRLVDREPDCWAPAAAAGRHGRMFHLRPQNVCPRKIRLQKESKQIFLLLMQGTGPFLVCVVWRVHKGIFAQALLRRLSPFA